MGNGELRVGSGQLGVGNGEVCDERIDRDPEVVEGRPPRRFRGSTQQGELARRTDRFARTIVQFIRDLPASPVVARLADQLLRSGTSAGANYRAATRARFQAEVIARLGIVEEEADESIYWLGLLADTRLAPPDQILPIHAEATEILKMTVASIKTAKRNRASR